MSAAPPDIPDAGGANLIPVHDTNSTNSNASHDLPRAQDLRHSRNEDEATINNDTQEHKDTEHRPESALNQTTDLDVDYESIQNLPDIHILDSAQTAPDPTTDTSAVPPVVPKTSSTEQVFQSLELSSEQEALNPSDISKISLSATTPVTDTIDDDVQIVECRVATRDESRGFHNAVSKSPIVIDLTEDDDDEDEQDSYMYNPINQEEPVKHIKTEPDHEVQSQIAPVRAEAGEASARSLDELPELGFTVVPEESITQPDLQRPRLDNEFHSVEMMADMLDQFNRNGEAEPLPEEVDSDEEDIRARVKFQNLEGAFKSRQERGEVGMEDQIAFERATIAEQERRLARKNRKQHEWDWNEAARAKQADSLFLPENDHMPRTHLDDHDLDSSSGYAYVSTVRSPTPSRESDVEVPAEHPTRGRPKGKKPNLATKKTAGKSGVSKKQCNKTASKRGAKRKGLVAIDTTSLLHHDIIAEATANQGQELPGFTARNKKDALAQLISSIPEEERNLYAGDKANLNKATQNFNGRGAIKADGDGHWKLRGMRTSLKNYQLLGVSWMRVRENQSKHPRGGILSDDMGLGKTVSALANMIDGRPASNYNGPKATLIVVPPSLMNQWLEEIEKHVEAPGNVMIYKSTMKFIEPAQYLAGQDIVITSYHEIVRSLPKKEPPPQVFTARAQEEWWLNEVAKNKGPLHQINWYRIVLDEAQAIKNHLSKTSEAICFLRGRFRWCLSGTPIQNGLEEFYPYFRFLKCENTGSFELFRHNFAKRGSEKALQRLQIFLGRIMLRRTHVDKLFGKPILVLPPIKPVQTIEVKFNAVERAIYHIVKQRFVLKVRALSHKDNPDNNYQAIFVLLLRLRQLVGHPLLIQKTLKDILEVEDLEKLWRLTRDAEAQLASGENDVDGGRDTAAALQVTLTAAQDPASSPNIPGSGTNVTRDNELSRKFRAYLQALRTDGNWTRANERSLCVACGCPPTGPYITSCMHLYCFSCLNDLRLDELMVKKDEATCLSCGLSIKLSQAYAATAFDEAYNNSNALSPRQTPDEDIDWYNVGGEILRSAKIKGAVAQIKAWFEQDPKNKILVFTQFRGLIKVMERVCREEKDWGYASYHGAMSFEYRDIQVKKFRLDPECRIMLAAMKAGGVGLNLTMANRVIILDLWWNVSVESQAFTRCFRIGQERDVEVVRFVVRDSIDTDIQAMQARKIAEIEKAMETNHRPRNLTTQELLELFGDAPEPTADQTDPAAGSSSQSNELIQLAPDNDQRFIFPCDPYDPMHAINDNEDIIMTGTS